MNEEDASKDQFFAEVGTIANEMIAAAYGKEFAMGVLILAARWIAEGKKFPPIARAITTRFSDVRPKSLSEFGIIFATFLLVDGAGATPAMQQSTVGRRTG